MTWGKRLRECLAKLSVLCHSPDVAPAAHIYGKGRWGMSPKRTWQQNAEEFALLDQGEGWPFAILVACSVEKGVGDGRPRKTSANAEVSGKASIVAFAARAGTSQDRVRRYLEAWNNAAKAGHCPSSTELGPADVDAVAYPALGWREHYAASNATMTYSTKGTTRSAKALLRRSPEAAEDIMSDQTVADRLLDTPAGRDRVEKAARKVAADNRRRAAELEDAYRKGEQHRANERSSKKADGDEWETHVAFAEVTGQLARARRAINDAIVEARDSAFDSDHVEVIVDRIEKLEAATGLLRLAVTGTLGVDWDAELVKLGDLT
jgi:hypothetical protein